MPRFSFVCNEINCRVASLKMLMVYEKSVKMIDISPFYKIDSLFLLTSRFKGQKRVCRDINGHIIKLRLSPVRYTSEHRTAHAFPRSITSFSSLLHSLWRHDAIPLPGVCCNAVNGDRRGCEGARVIRGDGSTNWGDDREGRATLSRNGGETV